MKLHITSNRTNNISGEIVTMFFHAAIILGYTEKGGYYYEEGKSYYNHVVLTDTQAREIAYRIGKILGGRCRACGTKQHRVGSHTEKQLRGLSVAVAKTLAACHLTNYVSCAVFLCHKAIGTVSNARHGR